MANGGCPATPAINTNWVQLAGDVVSLRRVRLRKRGRVALVTRSVMPDPKLNSPVPAWGGATAIDLTATQVPAGLAWQNYRYKPLKP